MCWACRLYPPLFYKLSVFLSFRPPAFLFFSHYCPGELLQDIIMDSNFVCNRCGKSYANAAAVARHRRRYCRDVGEVAALYQTELEREGERRRTTTFSDLELTDFINSELDNPGQQFVNVFLARKFNQNPDTINNLRRSKRYLSLKEEVISHRVGLPVEAENIPSPPRLEPLPPTDSTAHSAFSSPSRPLRFPRPSWSMMFLLTGLLILLLPDPPCPPSSPPPRRSS